eukprot:6369058-Amphidinium_carterae.1
MPPWSELREVALHPQSFQTLCQELIKLAETEWGEYLPDRVLLIDDDEIKCRSNEEVRHEKRPSLPTVPNIS